MKSEKLYNVWNLFRFSGLEACGEKKQNMENIHFQDF